MPLETAGDRASNDMSHKHDRENYPVMETLLLRENASASVDLRTLDGVASEAHYSQA